MSRDGSGRRLPRAGRVGRPDRVPQRRLHRQPVPRRDPARARAPEARGARADHRPPARPQGFDRRRDGHDRVRPRLGAGGRARGVPRRPRRRSPRSARRRWSVGRWPAPRSSRTATSSTRTTCSASPSRCRRACRPASSCSSTSGRSRSTKRLTVPDGVVLGKDWLEAGRGLHAGAAGGTPGRARRGLSSPAASRRSRAPRRFSARSSAASARSAARPSRRESVALDAGLQCRGRDAVRRPPVGQAQERRHGAVAARGQRAFAEPSSGWSRATDAAP